MNIKLNYTVRLTIENAELAVKAYANIPAFSLWDLVNFSKKREDKKKKEKFINRLTELNQFLKDIIASSEETVSLEHEGDTLRDDLRLVPNISDTDQDMLDRLEAIKLALQERKAIMGIERNVIKQIALYYQYLWQIRPLVVCAHSQRTEDMKLLATSAVTTLGDRRRETAVFRRRPGNAGSSRRAQLSTPPGGAFDYLAADLNAALDHVSYGTSQEPQQAKRAFSSRQTVIPTYYPSRQHHHSSAQAPAQQTRCAVGARRDKRLTEATTFFAPQVQNTPILSDEGQRVQSRKRSRAARDGVTVELRKSEHIQKKLRMEDKACVDESHGHQKYSAHM